MSAALAFGLALATLATAFVSGVFGMAGGLILLGIFLAVFDVATAQGLFGATQLSSNGWRAFLWRGHIRWGLVWRYCLGALAAFAAMRVVAFLPNKAMMYLGLGLTPFLVRALPRSFNPDILRPGAPFICGVVVMMTQLLAGVSGAVLDLFYQQSSLDRKTIVATKAATQVAAHGLRIVYVGSLAGEALTLPWWAYVGGAGLAMVGATLAARALHAMSDAGFKRWSWRIIAAVSLFYAARGAWMLITGSTR